MFKTIALAALAALMGADAFVSPVATSFTGNAVAMRVSERERKGETAVRVYDCADDFVFCVGV